MKKKLLFLPNDLGGGLGHLRRTLRIAALLKKDGWDIGVLTHRKKSLQFIDNSYNIFCEQFTKDKWLIYFSSFFNPLHSYPTEKMTIKPFFWEFASGNYQILRDTYFTAQIISRRFKDLCKIVEKWKPDAIIGDGHLLSYFIGKFFKLPVIQFTRYSIFPEKPHFIWWKQPSALLNPPPALKGFTPLFDLIQEDPGTEACQLFAGDAYLIPGTPAIEPILTSKPHLFYGYHIESSWDERLIRTDKKNRIKKIYITIGGGSGRTNVAKFYHFIYDAVQNLNMQVILSDPFEVLKGFPKKDSNTSIFKWIESSSVFPELNLIIHHGGYSTTLESLWWGIPAIVIPAHTEQEGNGRRIESLSAGKVLLVSKPPYQLVNFKSYYGNYNIFAGCSFDLTAVELIDAIDRVITNTKYRESAIKQSENLKSYYNPEKITKFINENI